jgi:hypothetical protein
VESALGEADVTQSQQSLNQLFRGIPALLKRKTVTYQKTRIKLKKTDITVKQQLKLVMFYSYCPHLVSSSLEAVIRSRRECNKLWRFGNKGQ